MDFEYSPRVRSLQAKLLQFVEQHIYPNEARYSAEVAANRAAGNAFKALKLIEELKPRARDAQLWNLFLPRSPRAPEGLSNLEYAPLCEIMGRVPWSPEVFNCAAPDTGNMETIERYGSEEQKDRWLSRCSPARSARRS
jgi:acyl-CoA dehydrogenase